jgi:hypothetical protein
MNEQIKNHANFSAADYAYLSAIGWSDEKILARWNQERDAGKSACLWNTIGAKAKLDAVLRNQSPAR